MFPLDSNELTSSLSSKTTQLFFYAPLSSFSLDLSIPHHTTFPLQVPSHFLLVLMSPLSFKQFTVIIKSLFSSTESKQSSSRIGIVNKNLVYVELAWSTPFFACNGWLICCPNRPIASGPCSCAPSYARRWAGLIPTNRTTSLQGWPSEANSRIWIRVIGIVNLDFQGSSREEYNIETLIESFRNIDTENEIFTIYLSLHFGRSINRNVESNYQVLFRHHFYTCE